MKFTRRLCLSFCAALFCFCLNASTSAQPFANSNARASTLPPVSIISTLYSNDPAAHALCFTDGGEGATLQKNGISNRCSHLDFDKYNSGALTVGIEGGELGKIIDLGTADDLRKQYGYEETVGNGNGFASIEVQDGKVLILKTLYKPVRQELTLANALFEKGASGASAVAKVGHIYLARLTDSHDKDFQILVKLLVLSVRPGESVTLRWQLL